jgi:hypothetical protein
MKRVLILFVLLLSINLASAQSLHTTDWVLVETTVTNQVNFSKTSPFSFNYLDVNFTFVPVIDYRQKINNLGLSGEGVLSSNSYNMRILEPNNFTIQVKGLTNTTSLSLPITRKVDFPIVNLNQNLLPYLEFTDLIDSNDDIKQKAAMIAGNKDDLFDVVFSVATWVNSNVEYNLSTLTANANLPSSWVLENKEGVCDEISNLFISMLRSLGIPARFVSGMSYTDSALFEENWGLHGWVEVYFPGFGWVPFDPTYNQLGFVDATHIKFNDGVDGSKYSNKFAWSARNVEVVLGGLKFESNLIEVGAQRESDIELDVYFESNSISFDSYNEIYVTVTNLRPYYVGRSFNLATVKELSIFSDERVDLWLSPYETKEFSWVVYVSKLNPDFVYSFPALVYSNMNETKRNTFDVSLNGKTLTNNFIRSKDNGGSNVSFSCEIINDGYINSDAFGLCNLDEAVGSICFENNCFEINTTDSFKFPINLSSGFRTYVFEYKGEENVFSFVPFTAIIEPKLSFEIEGFNQVSNLSNQRFNITLTRQGSDLNNVTIRVKSGLFDNKIYLGSIQNKASFEVLIPKESFGLNNNLIITAEYFDLHGKRYEVSERFPFRLENVTLFDKFRLMINEFISLLI